MTCAQTGKAGSYVCAGACSAAVTRPIVRNVKARMRIGTSLEIADQNSLASLLLRPLAGAQRLPPKLRHRPATRSLILARLFPPHALEFSRLGQGFVIRLEHQHERRFSWAAFVIPITFLQEQPRHTRSRSTASSRQAPSGTMRKIVGFVILALLVAAAMHPNNRYHPPQPANTSSTP